MAAATSAVCWIKILFRLSSFQKEVDGKVKSVQFKSTPAQAQQTKRAGHKSIVNHVCIPQAAVRAGFLTVYFYMNI